MQGAQQKVYVLEPTEIRTNSNGLSFGIATVLCKATNYNKVHDLFFPEKFIAKLNESVRRSVILNGYSLRDNGQMNLTDSSKIMDTFDDKSHSTTVVHFLKPEPEDIATIKTKAKRERVSIKGVIHKSNISNPFTGEMEFGIYSNVEQCPVSMEENLDLVKIL
nr:uncharacterized protein LOC117685518 [Crassostrea gigas]